jgi:hypothetical protein
VAYTYHNQGSLRIFGVDRVLLKIHLSLWKFSSTAYLIADQGGIPME